MEDLVPSGTEAPAIPGYAVGRCLGRGGSAAVWLVTDESTGRDYALKCFASAGGAGGEEADQEAGMRREVGILSALDHDHLVRAHAVVRTGGSAVASADGGAGLGLVLDYAAGGSLAALVAGRGRLGAGETVTVLTPIAQALAYLHALGFTHGDVAPGNVLFTAHGKPLLADLGVARMVGDATPAAGSGTDGFRDPAPVDAVRAGLQPERDVYSLAALGWYCLSGRSPEPGSRRPPLPLLVPGVPADLAEALEAGLRADRRLRPTAAELAAAFFRSAVAEPVDLSGSVHSTVIPELLTRRAFPRTPWELRAERVRGWSARFLRRIGPNPGEVPPRAAATRGPARQTGCPPSEGRRSASRRRAAGAGRRLLGMMFAVLAVMLVLATVVLPAGARLPWPFPLAGAPGPDLAADGRPAGVPPGRAGPEAVEPVPEAVEPGPEAVEPGPEAVEPVPVPQDIEALLSSADPGDAVRGLARLRSLAFNSGDLRLLDAVNVPQSPAADADGRTGARLRASGHVLTGFSTVLTAVERSQDSGPLRTVMAVSVAQSAYQERDAGGALVAEAAAGGERRLRLVLVLVDGRWRIQEILPGSGAPG